MSKEYMTEAPVLGKWYISESTSIKRTDEKGLIEPQLVPREMRLAGPFSTEEEAKKKLPYWQQQENCHELFIWQNPNPQKA
jgi:hypothetical protein